MNNLLWGPGRFLLDFYPIQTPPLIWQLHSPTEAALAPNCYQVNQLCLPSYCWLYSVSSFRQERALRRKHPFVSSLTWNRWTHALLIPHPMAPFRSVDHTISGLTCRSLPQIEAMDVKNTSWTEGQVSSPASPSVTPSTNWEQDGIERKTTRNWWAARKPPRSGGNLCDPHLIDQLRFLPSFPLCRIFRGGFWGRWVHHVPRWLAFWRKAPSNSINIGEYWLCKQ